MKKSTIRLFVTGMVAVVTSVTLFFATSCKKDNQESTSPAASTANPTTGASLDGLTPFSAGEYHNAALWAISDNTDDLSTLGSMANFDEYKASVINFCIQNQVNINGSMLTQAFVQNIINQVKAGTLIQNMYASQSISAAVRDKLIELSTTLSSVTTHEDGINYLNQFITTVNAAEQFSASEKDLLIGTASVAKGSASFWVDAVDNSQNVWNRVARPTEGGPTYALKVKWWKLLGDALGFAGGTLAGGPAVGVGCAGLVSACIE